MSDRALASNGYTFGPDWLRYLAATLGVIGESARITHTAVPLVVGHRGFELLLADVASFLPGHQETVTAATIFAEHDVPAIRLLPGVRQPVHVGDHVATVWQSVSPVGPVPGLSLVLNTYARATGLFRRDALVAVGGWDADLPGFEDWDLYLRLDAAGYDSDVLPVEGHRYRRHPQSMTFTAGRSSCIQSTIWMYRSRKTWTRPSE